MLPDKKLRALQDELRAHARPALTVDLVILTVVDTDLKILLIQRDREPYLGQDALPGGFVRAGDLFEDQGEDLLGAAQRELKTKTGLDPAGVYLEQLYTFGKSGRDPRMRVISVAYYALIRPDLMASVVAGQSSTSAKWVSVAEELDGVDLAFDHSEIIDVAVERIRGKLDYVPIAFSLVPMSFTAAELRQVYEAIKGEHYDARNFSRRLKRMVTDGLIEAAPGKRQTQTKPAKVYRFIRKAEQHYP